MKIQASGPNFHSNFLVLMAAGVFWAVFCVVCWYRFFVGCPFFVWYRFLLVPGFVGTVLVLVVGFAGPFLFGCGFRWADFCWYPAAGRRAGEGARWIVCARQRWFVYAFDRLGLPA